MADLWEGAEGPCSWPTPPSLLQFQTKVSSEGPKILFDPPSPPRYCQALIDRPATAVFEKETAST